MIVNNRVAAKESLMLVRPTFMMTIRRLVQASIYAHTPRKREHQRSEHDGDSIRSRTSVPSTKLDMFGVLARDHLQ